MPLEFADDSSHSKSQSTGGGVPQDLDDRDGRLEAIVEAFMEEVRQGRNPSLSSYANANPDIASEIRELLPLVSMVESAGRPSSAIPLPRGKTPESLGGYRITREIGRGGMGIVYEAEQHSPRRRVALKILPYSEDLTARERFRREAEAAAKLQHPNIIPVYEVGTSGHSSDGTTYYTMQLIDGFGLDTIRDEIGSFRSAPAEVNSYSAVAQLLLHEGRLVKQRNSGSVEPSSNKTQPLNPSPTIYYQNVAVIVAQAAEAVAHAHENEIIHRDIKPSNILVDRSGHVWVNDFGLAKFEDDELTRTGDIVGTVRYMAPERFREECDKRADIYSLGITLFELLTLQTPFSSPDRLQVIKQICDREPTPPRMIDQRIPVDLETIVLKAIEKEPDRRYASCHEFAMDLHRFLRDEPIQARRLGQVERAVRWARKNRLLASSLVTTVLACLIAMAGLLVLAGTRERARLDAIRLRIDAEEARNLAESEAIANEQNLYFLKMNLANRALESMSGIVLARETLREWNRDSRTNITIGWEWDYVHSETNKELFVMGAGVVSQSWSPAADAHHLAIAHDRGVVIRDMKSGVSVYERDVAGVVSAVTWVNQNELVVGTETGEVQILNWQTDELGILVSSDAPILDVSASSDKTKLAIVTATRCTIVDLASHHAELRIGSNGLAHAWHPTENRLLVSTGTYSYACVDVATGVVDEGESSELKVNAIQWDSTGTKVLVAGNIGAIGIADTTSPSNRSKKLFHRHYLHAIRRVPRTDIIASAGADRLIHFWRLNDDLPLYSQVGAEDYVFDLRFSADGQFMSARARGGTLRIWNTPDSDLNRSSNLPTWAGCQHGIAFHPDNAHVFSVIGGGSVGMHRIGSSRPKKPWVTLDSSVAAPGLGINAIAIDPQGRQLAWSAGFESGVIYNPLSIADSGWTEMTSSSMYREKTHQIFALDFSPDGRLLVRGGSVKLEIWDTQSRQSVFTESRFGNKFKSVRFSQDGKWIAAGGYHKARIYQVAPNRFVRELDTHGITTRLAFSPDGDEIAIASGSGIVELFAFPDGAFNGVLRGHRQDVFTVDWHPSGDRIATGSSDGTVRIWDAKSHQQVLAFEAESTPVLSVEWSRDGKTLASVSAGNGLKIRTVR